MDKHGEAFYLPAEEDPPPAPKRSAKDVMRSIAWNRNKNLREAADAQKKDS